MDKSNIWSYGFSELVDVTYTLYFVTKDVRFGSKLGQICVKWEFFRSDLSIFWLVKMFNLVKTIKFESIKNFEINHLKTQQGWCFFPSSESCNHDGKQYADGETFKDRCNTCECHDGHIGCTRKHCIGIVLTNNLIYHLIILILSICTRVRTQQFN